MTVVETWKLLEEEAMRNLMQGIIRRRIFPHSNLDMFLGIKTPSKVRLLLLRVPKSLITDSTALPTSKGFEVRVTRFHGDHDGFAVIELAITNTQFTDIFTTLVDDVVNSLLIQPQGTDIVGAFFSRLLQWQSFLDRYSPQGLGEEAQRGLFGELTFLREYVLCNRDSKSAVMAWTGPKKAVHDFQFPRCSVEVKTTIAKQHQKLQIASERQLDDANLEALFVLHLSLSTQFNTGETLVEIIGNIRNLLESDFEALMNFENALFESGYLDAHVDRYSKTRYSLRESNVFQVQEGFPRIIERDVPSGVGDIRYSVMVSECRHYAVTDSELISFITG